VSVMDLYSSLQGWRVRESERVTETEETSKTRGDYDSTKREQRYVSEPIETKYFNLKFIGPCIFSIVE